MMKIGGRTVLMCSCDGTMAPDAKSVAAALGAEPPATIHTQLCRSQVDAYRKAVSAGEPVLVCCGQEAPLFEELAAMVEAEPPLCVDLRDRAGWSAEGGRAAPKMAALLAEAMVAVEPTPSVTLASRGAVLVLGRGQTVLDAARRLGAAQAVTCVLLPGGDDLMPPSIRALGLFQGRPLAASGHFGAFKVAIADLAGASPSARGWLSFEAVVGERTLSADIVLDLTEGPALVGPRDGWVRVDPKDVAAFERALADIAGMVGEFEKPRWIKIDAAACAHSRNGQIACTRCLDVCPSGALTPKGDSAAVDAHICGGHGPCASVCPTGAISFDVPAGNGHYLRLAALLETYAAAGGERPVVLLHDLGHGSELIAALARFGDGLPANVLPLALPAVAALGPDFLLTALAKGAARVVVMADPARRDDLDPLRRAVLLANRVMAAQDWHAETVMLVESDPAGLAAALAPAAPVPVAPAAEFLVLGGKRQTLALALAHLNRHAPRPITELALDPGDPFGTIVVDAAKCTLCMACVPACPAKALSGHPDKPSLGIVEANCVQCGLCRATCPEKAVSLVARLAFGPEIKLRQTLKEEEPFGCIRCGKPFASKSVIERMVERMSGHSMFAAPGKLDLIKMCEDCRVVAQYEMETGARPLAGAQPPVPRTTDDYLRERDGKTE